MSAIFRLAAPVTPRESAPRQTLTLCFDLIEAISSGAPSQSPPVRPGIADRLDFAVRKPKNWWPFQLVPVIALAICDRLTQVAPFQAKPFSRTITRSSLPFHSRTSSAPALRLTPLRVVGIRVSKGRAFKALSVWPSVGEGRAESLYRDYERAGLNAVGHGPQEQPPRQMGGRGPAQVIAPLQTKPAQVEIGEARDCLTAALGCSRVAGSCEASQPVAAINSSMVAP